MAEKASREECKKLVVLLSLLGVFGLLTALLLLYRAKSGTNVPPPSVETGLKITTSLWSGWSEASGKETEETVLVKKVGQKVSLEGFGDHELTVVDFDQETITLEGDGLELKEDPDEKGIDLTACGPQKFTLKIDDTVKLNTCTMDAGASWKVTYE